MPDQTRVEELEQRLRDLRIEKIDAYGDLAECRRHDDEAGADAAFSKIDKLVEQITEVRKELGQDE